MEDKNITYTISGGQINIAKDNSTINAIQNNGVSVSELDNIIKEIMENLSGLEKEKADEIIDVVNMIKEELEKPEPRVSRLKNCVTLISPIVTIVNGIPILANNLQKLIGYISPFIH